MLINTFDIISKTSFILRIELKNPLTMINIKLMDFFYFSATLDTVSILTATTSISLVLSVTFILYMVIKKCLKSRQAPIRNYDMPEVVTMGGKYETLQRKKPSDEVENNPAVAYMEIAAISSEYINLN